MADGVECLYIAGNPLLRGSDLLYAHAINDLSKTSCEDSRERPYDGGNPFSLISGAR
jgi:hypothetical protein